MNEESYVTRLNKAPRSKLRGINCALATYWLSASFRPKGRGIEPEEIKDINQKGSYHEIH